MKDEKCPFLEVTTVTFCKAFPVKKMIPLDKSSSAKGVCTTDSFRQCPAFREINAHNSEAEHVRGFHLKPGYYFHPKHVWISPSEASEGEARAGIDDFSQKIIGPIDNLTLPPEGSVVKENNVCILLHSGKRTARMVAPSDGIIQSINRKITADPKVLNRDPYKWLDCEVERLQKVFSADLGITATDGGESLPDISGRLTEAQWSRIVTLFLG
jgi:glycine cleavage system H lipoate-binding protein